MSTTIVGPGETETATPGLDVEAGGRNGDGPDNPDGGRKGTTADFLDPDGEVIATVQLPDNPDPEREGEMFGGSHFENAKVYVDDQAADGLVIGFGGSISLAGIEGIPEEQDVEFFNDLGLGKSVELTLTIPGGRSVKLFGRVAGKAGSWKENAEGETTVTGKATVKVTSLQL